MQKSPRQKLGRTKATAKKVATKAKPRATPKKAKPSASPKKASKPRLAAAVPERFRLAPSEAANGSSSLGSWRPPWGNLFANANYNAEFLGRLWALFGAPNQEPMEGFGYTLVDATSKQIVTAYSGSSGPSFGGFDNKETRVAISALQRQLNLTKPTDCKLDYDEPEGARVAIGIRKGRPFFALLRTYED